ncbi:MAG: PorT family protein [Bacteroidaceae bacterium]|nr:PorT family protein [Bacteroidaceae bacterium]
MVNLPLTKRLALETGLSYSRLHSTFDQGNVTFYQHTQQTLHYLGLPLHLHYNFISHYRWRLYGLAGLQVDFPVSATAETTHQAPYGSSSPTTDHLSAPVQFAPVIGLGAQLNLTRHAALFVQPSLQWYIHTGSSIKTYRSEHPLTFAIPFGFRWTL